MRFTGDINYVLVDCISGLPLYELTVPANAADSTSLQQILAAANHTLDYRLSIDQDYSRFKRTYALRMERERYNFRFRSSGQERLWIRNGNSAALAVALTAVQSSPRRPALFLFEIHKVFLRRNALIGGKLPRPSVHILRKPPTLQMGAESAAQCMVLRKL